MTALLKDNWQNTKQNFIKWWNHKGFLVGQWESGIPNHTSDKKDCFDNAGLSPEQIHTDASWRAEQNHLQLCCRDFPLDILPISETDLGPGSLSIYLGSEPEFSPNTVWYHPCNIKDNAKLQFDIHQKWWKIQEELIKKCIERSQNRYFVGSPDVAEGLDILASLFGIENILTDMITRPGWVKEKLEELHYCYMECFDRICDLVTQDEGMVFRAFCLWGPSKTAKVQCDTAAMISPKMFNEFVIPHLTQQCEWLEYSMFHLDGTQCIGHLDSLLEIDKLDAVEWTPQAGIPGCADKQWHEMYKRILGAGKSVQLVCVKPHEIIPLLDTLGTNGVYILAEFNTQKEAETIAAQVERFR